MSARLARQRETRNRMILSLAGLAAVVAAAAALAWLSHARFRDALAGNVRAQLLLVAESEAQSIEKHLDDVREQIAFASEEPALRRLLVGRLPFRRGGDALRVAFRSASPLVESVALLDGGGIVREAYPRGSAGGDLSGEEGFREAARGGRPVAALVGGGDAVPPAVALYHPVLDGDRFAGAVRAVIPIGRLSALLEHINRGERVYAMLCDGDGTILCGPEGVGVGRTVPDLLREECPACDQAAIGELAERMRRGEEGSLVVRFVARGTGPGVVPTLVAFAPVRLGAQGWSLAAAMEYGAIADPVAANARRNLALVAAVFAAFAALAVIVFRSHRESYEAMVSARACQIVNRQLHLELDDLKRLKEALENGRKEPPRGPDGAEA
ncbi:MAG: cache domain-containing protein [bacterium]|nr:cache domain-containing protein [bacterium]